MSEIFCMPKLGMDMEEGAVSQWMKAEGDTVKKGEIIAEIETDKTVVEVDVSTDGILLKIYCEEMDPVPVGTPIAFIGQAGDRIPTMEELMAAPAEAAAETPAAPAAEEKPAEQPNGTFFLMPKLGMDMEEGAVSSWLKKEGEPVKKGEPLAEIETDKSCVEVEAPADGILLKIYCVEMDTVPCGTPIAFIGPEGAAAPAAGGAAVSGETAPAEQPAAQSDADVDGTFFRMPKLGMDMEEGAVSSWLKKEGEPVKKGEPLAEIETDKSCVEVEAPADGVLLKIYCGEMDTVPCGTPIAFIGPEGAAAPDAAAADAPAKKQEEKPQAAPVQAAAPAQSEPAVRAEGERVIASPRARRFAAQNGVELAEIAGTGENGRIIEQNVKDYLASGCGAKKPVRKPEETVVPLAGVRKVIARRMKQSLANAAQANHRVDVDMSNLLNFRKQMNAFLERDGIKVSVLDILACACARALIEHPMANAYLLDDGIHMHNYANVGIAVNTDRGLVVPVVKDADILSLPEFAVRSKEVIGKARKGALKPEDMSGGTFSISNLGMYEIDSFTAVLNPPETCILAVGRTQDKVVVENGQMVIRPMMTICLTYDHQLLDGAPAAEFLQTIKHYIENPVWLML